MLSNGCHHANVYSTNTLKTYERGRCISATAYLLWILCHHDASTLSQQPTRTELPFYLYLMCADGAGLKSLNGANELRKFGSWGHVVNWFVIVPFRRNVRGGAEVVRCMGQPTTRAILGYIKFSSTHLSFVWLDWSKKFRSTPKFKVRLVACLRPSDWPPPSLHRVSAIAVGYPLHTRAPTSWGYLFTYGLSVILVSCQNNIGPTFWRDPSRS